MPVDLFASKPHYLHHALPVFQALPPSAQGRIWLTREAREPGRRMGLTSAGETVPKGPNPVIVASLADERAVRQQRTPIYLEHGAGQTYQACPELVDNPSYSGSPDHDRVGLFLCPSEPVADRWRARYPSTPAVAIGCPFLDPWHAALDGRVTSGPSHPAVAVSFHFDYPRHPELRSTLPHYLPALQGLATWGDMAGIRVIGHAHPRAWKQVAPVFADHGILPVRDWGTVLDLATVYAVDNSSTAMEFASLDRPIMFLNAPHYRRDVNHGGRFWSWTRAGQQVDEPGELVPLVAEVVDGPDRFATARREVVAEVYAACDGKASQRGAEAILSVYPLT